MKKILIIPNSLDLLGSVLEKDVAGVILPITNLSVNRDLTFSLEEIKYAISKGYKSVSLGQARLRTETAALSAVMMCHLSR